MDGTDFLKPAVTTSSPGMQSALDGLKNHAVRSKELSGEARTQELKKATQEFEALFVSYLLKVMRSTVPESGEESTALGKDTYMEMFDQEIALQIARTRSLGIGELMFKQLADGVKDKPEKEDGPSAPKPAVLSPTPNQTAPIPALPVQPREGFTALPSTPQLGTAAKTRAGLEPAAGWTPPVEGPTSSHFGLRTDPFTHHLKFHHGVDVAAPAGSPVRAAHSGTVVFSGYLAGYGNTVILDHEKGYRTLYAHTARNLVGVGEAVDADQVIGMVGSSGRSTGAHLHFELQKDGERLDPGGYLTSTAMLRPVNSKQ